MFDFRVIGVLQGLLSNGKNQTLHGFLELFKRQLSKSLVLPTQTASWTVILVLILDIKHLSFDLQILEESF